MSDQVELAIDVLLMHQRLNDGSCSCGWTGPTLHARHVAERLDRANLLRKLERLRPDGPAERFEQATKRIENALEALSETRTASSHTLEREQKLRGEIAKKIDRLRFDRALGLGEADGPKSERELRYRLGELSALAAAAHIARGDL